jgi:hypothetical protein
MGVAQDRVGTLITRVPSLVHAPSDLPPYEGGADDRHMSRPLRLCGAIAVIASLWLPWYGVTIPDAVRQAVDAQAGQLPDGFADFARGILASLPKSIELNGWQAFEGADVAIALIAGAAALSVLMAIDVRAVLGAAAAIAGLVIVHVLDQPGPNEIVAVKAGPWVALAGAGAIALSARAEPTPAAAPPAFPPPSPTETWAPPATASVPPPR